MENCRQRTIIPSGQSVHNFSSNSSDGEEDGSNGVQYCGRADFESIEQMVAKSWSWWQP
jgi:hypothetical protein